MLISHTPTLNTPSREPIAIVGIGCHLPGGVVDPDSFWRLLVSKTDATCDIPEDRWDIRKFCDDDGSTLGKTCVHHGGFLDRIDEFDPAFFRISPREAVWLDPQQRLALRVAWESIDDAGLDLADLAGTDVGVFMGGFTLDYQLLQNYGVQSRYELDAHSATGMMMTMLSNRISHAFDFTGPSLSIDTACSGSLVAVHSAVQAIRNGECSAALAGGVNVMLVPNMTIAETKGGFLSPDGRCKTFDISANGYARGEGAAVVMLKPLSAAEADNDDIYAVIRGSAVTHDGRTSSITVPNPDAQIHAMQAAYLRADISPADVSYVEAHGTGTPVGDPLEVRAIGTVVNPDGAKERRVVIGSVKTNIGHLEAAAGVVGLIKTALSLRNRTIAPHLNFNEPNPAVPLEEFNLHVPTETIPWPAPVQGPRIAGVNSFGFGGTNAHVIVSEYIPGDDVQQIAHIGESGTSVDNRTNIHILPISARSPEALRDAANRVGDMVANGADLCDVAHSLATCRTHHEYRGVVVASERRTALNRLRELAEDQPGPGMVTGHALSGAQAPKVAFVCSGMGPQWWAMGRQLYVTEPVFAHEIERVDVELSRYADFSLVEEMMKVSEDVSRMQETQIAQPANFAIQLGLAALWASRGVIPDGVLGHSTGEVASQYLSGVLSFTEAVKVIYFRSSLQQRATGTGRMLAVGLSADSLYKALQQKPEGVSVAAVNSPNSVTLSGDADALADIANQLEIFGVFNKFLNVEVPYHSPLMDPLREDLLAGLADLQTRDADIALYSTVTGTRIRGGAVDAGYWWRNVRRSVQFAAAFSELVSDGYTHIVELSPHPVLATSMQEVLDELDTTATIVHSMYRGAHDQDTFFAALGTLHCSGLKLPWATYSDSHARRIKLPSYPWQLKSYWNESLEAREDRHYLPVHPLLGQTLNGPHPTWEIDFNPSLIPFVCDHQISGNVILPGVALVEMMRAAAVDTYGAADYTIEEVEFRHAVRLDAASHPRLRTTLDPETGEVEIVGFYANPNGERSWTVHATGKVTLARISQDQIPDTDQENLLSVVTTPLAFYELLRTKGFEYGPSFQTVHRIEQGPTLTRARIALPKHLARPASQAMPTPNMDTARSSIGTADVNSMIYPVHPVILDAAMQVLLPRGSSPNGDESGTTAPFVPVHLDRVTVTASDATEFDVIANVHTADAFRIVSDVWVVTDQGDVVVHIGGFTAQSLEARTVPSDRADLSLHHIEWEPLETVERRNTDQRQLTPNNFSGGTSLEAQPTKLVVLMDCTGLGESLCRASIEAGLDVLAVYKDRQDLNGAPNIQGVDRVLIQLEDLAGYRGLLASLDPNTPSRLINLWPLEVSTHASANPQQAQRNALISVLRLAQATYPPGEDTEALHRSGAVDGLAESAGHGENCNVPNRSAVPSDLRIWAVTRCAQPVFAEEDPNLALASVWGMSRVLAHAEMPSIWAGVIDLDRDCGDYEHEAAVLLNHVTGEQTRMVDSRLEDQIALRAGTMYVPRLAQLATSRASFPVRVDANATYLITGGLGALGRVIAADLGRRGAGRIVLMGRSELPERSSWRDLPSDHQRAGVVADLVALEDAGVRVEVATVDVSDARALNTWLRSEQERGVPPVRGVIHAAGLVRDALVPDMSLEDFDAVLEPKVAGGWNLHTVFAKVDLDFFVLFSSTGAVVASPGQINYAAGNAFLDALAAHRRAHGLPAVSVGWGPWSVGMVAELGLEDFYARRGIALIGPEAGRRIMDRVLMNPPAHMLAIAVDWTNARRAAGGTLPQMFNRLGERCTRDSDGSLLTEVHDLSGTSRAEAVHEAITTLVCRVLGLDPNHVDADASLGTLGLDSMMAIEVKARLAVALNVEVSVLDLVQGTSLTGLAARVLDLIGAGETGDETPEVTSEESSTQRPATPEGASVTNGADFSAPNMPASVSAVTATNRKLLELLADVSDDELEQLLSELEDVND